MQQIIRSDAAHDKFIIAWQSNAYALAEWSMKNLVVRYTAYGGYNTVWDAECQGWKHKPTTCYYPVTLDLLAHHFAATDCNNVIGLYPADENNQGKWFGTDLDLHGKQSQADEARNKQAALHWYAQLTEMGVTCLLTDEGKGGYHLLCLFTEKLSAETLHFAGKALVRNFAKFGLAKPPEVFPKQRDIRGRGKGVGNFLRLFGKHPSYRRDSFSIPYDGKRWLTDPEEAIAFILSLQSNSFPSDSFLNFSLESINSSKVSNQNTDDIANDSPQGIHSTPLNPISQTLQMYSIKEDNRGMMLTDRLVQMAAIHRPKRISERNDRLLDFVRAVRREKKNLTSGQLRSVFKEWWKGAKEVVATKHEPESWKQFVDMWGRLKETPKELNVVELLANSKNWRLPERSFCLSEKMRIILRAVWFLQQLSQWNLFYLSNRDAGRLVGSSEERGRYLLGQLRERGFIERLSMGNNYSGKASEYRCIS